MQRDGLNAQRFRGAEEMDEEEEVRDDDKRPVPKSLNNRVGMHRQNPGLLRQLRPTFVNALTRPIKSTVRTDSDYDWSILLASCIRSPRQLLLCISSIDQIARSLTCMRSIPNACSLLYVINCDAE